VFSDWTLSKDLISFFLPLLHSICFTSRQLHPRLCPLLACYNCHWTCSFPV